MDAATHDWPNLASTLIFAAAYVIIRMKPAVGRQRTPGFAGPFAAGNLAVPFRHGDAKELSCRT
jgi:hypothetical protein